MEKQFVSFWVGDNRYCIDIMDVMEVVRESKVTKMPDVPRFMEGIINLRGVVTPVLSVRKKLGIDSAEDLAIEAVKPVVVEEVTENGVVETTQVKVTSAKDKNRAFMKLIIVKIDAVQVGFLVDSLDRVFTIEDSMIQSADGVASNINRVFVEGLVTIEDNVYILLNVAKILDIEEKRFINNEIIEEK